MFLLPIAIGLAACVLVYVLTGGHVVLLPLLFFLPLGIAIFGRRRQP